jgi:hypothetical protein
MDPFDLYQQQKAEAAAAARLAEGGTVTLHGHCLPLAAIP